MSAQSQLYTVVKNLAGSTRFYGFLGPRGVRLSNNEVYSVPGDLVASLTSDYRSHGSRKHMDALERALKSGALRIESRPAPTLLDSTTSLPLTLAVANGVLGNAAPTYS